jgi:hypothetical protein
MVSRHGHPLIYQVGGRIGREQEIHAERGYYPARRPVCLQRAYAAQSGHRASCIDQWGARHDDQGTTCGVIGTGEGEGVGEGVGRAIGTTGVTGTGETGG